MNDEVARRACPFENFACCREAKPSIVRVAESCDYQNGARFFGNQRLLLFMTVDAT